MKKLLLEKLLSILDLQSNKPCNVLDLGCGPGYLLDAISSAVPAGSVLVGIDPSEKAIDQARNAYPSIDFRRERFVDSLSLPDSSFDIVLSVDTLECIPNKTAFVAEAHRLLKSDGKLLCAHWDWDTQVYCSEHKHIIRALVAEFSDWQQGWMDACDGQMGRKLWALFQGSGKFAGRMESFTLLETSYKEGNYGYDRLHDLMGLVEKGRIRQDDYQLIIAEMENLSQNSQYFYSINSYIYYGTKV